jgi:membrane-associated protease RseP (regulator of RpoE activity)
VAREQEALMVRTAIFSLLAALPIALGASARAGAGDHWPFDAPFLSPRGRIGVQVDGMTPELRGYFHAPEDRGLLVVSVEPDRPGARAGLRVGDVILSAAGHPLRDSLDLIRIVAAAKAGESIELAVLRDAEERALRVEPEGEPSLWAEPERFGAWFEEKMDRGSRALLERIEELERRLEELERRLEERDQGTGEAARET